MLLEEGKVDCVLGFEAGSLRFATTPLLTNDPAMVDRLVINPFITSNLAVFLPDLKGRVAVVAKGCDSRSIVSLIQDHKVSRETLVIVGVPCSGLIDIKKIEKLSGREREAIDGITVEGERVLVSAGGEKLEFLVKEVVFDHCLACELPTPREYDVLLGEPTHPRDKESQTKSREAISRLKGMSAAARWAYWRGEFGRCIRCYACRNACPVCFCERCFVEETEPAWVQPIARWQDNLIFQVTRNLHVAGRCTDCGNCERACPVGIPLRSLSREVYDIVGDLFGYQAGMDKEAAPLLGCYQATDIEDFIK